MNEPPRRPTHRRFIQVAGGTAAGLAVGTPPACTATANGATVSLAPFYKIRENHTVYWRTSS